MTQTTERLLCRDILVVGWNSQQMQSGFAFSQFAKRLTSLADLTDSDLQLLAEMPAAIHHFAPREILLRKGDRAEHCCVLLQGYLCWRNGSGRDRQITAIHVPGDVPDLHAMLMPCADATLTALGPAVVALVPHAFFHRIAGQSRKMAHALSMLSLADIGVLRNWVVNLGTRNAMMRVTHLLCEIVTRLQAVGQAGNHQFPSPFTQSDLAAACGISAVHANRIIQDLRRAGSLQWRSKTITITDWNALLRLSGFTPGYLQLRSTETMGAASPREAAAQRPRFGDFSLALP